MKFWNYIGGFFLFRWLFGSHKHNEAKPDVPDATVNPVDSDSMDNLDSCAMGTTTLTKVILVMITKTMAICSRMMISLMSRTTTT